MRDLSVASCLHPLIFIQKGELLRVDSYIEKQQSCEIFVEMKLESRTIGAAHRNIYSQSIICMMCFEVRTMPLLAVASFGRQRI